MTSSFSQVIGKPESDSLTKYKVIVKISPFHHLFSHFLPSSTSYQKLSKIMAGQVYCMVMRVNVDCNACCRKMRRILLNMKEIEKHSIEKQHYRVTVYGKFMPADVAIKIRKKMNRRVEILEIHDMSGSNGDGQETSPVSDHHESQYG